MKYATLFRVRQQHSFFASGFSPDLKITATPGSEKIIRGHRLEYRKKPDGLDILCPLNETGTPFVPLGTDFSLRFQVWAKKEYFFNYTNLSSLQGTKLPVFSNASLSHHPTGIYTLSAAPGEQDHPGNPGSLIAELEISSGVSLPGPPAVTPEFRMEFSSRSMTWKYFLIAETNGQDISLIDKANIYSFHKVHLVENADLSALPGDPSRDHAIHQLAERFPERQRYLFESAQPIEFRESGYKGLQLMKGTLPLLKDLSNPLPEKNGIQFIMK